MFSDAQLAARAYARGLRNAKKKWYAQQCVSWVLGWTTQAPDPDGLSIMGQQAVRMELARIMGGEGKSLPD